MKKPAPIETSRSNYPTKWRNNAEELIRQSESTYANKTILEERVNSSGNSGNLPATIAYFRYLSVDWYTTDVKYSCYYRHFTTISYHTFKQFKAQKQ